MSADENEGEGAAGGRKLPRLSDDDASALWWLVRWIGLPLIVVAAVYYGEPLVRGRQVEVVPTITRHRVQPYPFPEGATGPSLAPPEAYRPERLPVEIPYVPETVPGVEIVANPLSQPQPQYPRRALEAEKEGVVRLRITIAPDGAVEAAEIVEARPQGWFESAALNAVRRWRYQPPGRALQTDVEIEFKLN